MARCMGQVEGTRTALLCLMRSVLLEAKGDSPLGTGLKTWEWEDGA